jgi:hypothetical protein
MRSLALTALLGSFIASTSLFGQSLTEHAAAVAGATIGTAAGKPIGTALGKIFGDVDQSASRAAGPKTAKPVASKPEAVAPAVATEHASVPVVAPVGGPVIGGDTAVHGVSAVNGVSSHRSPGRREAPLEPQPLAAVPLAPVVAEIVAKEPTVEDVASVQVGASANELSAALGAPESRVSIPGDDGHLLEICQYWAKGEPVGTIRLDNGRVVSVQARN